MLTQMFRMTYVEAAGVLGCPVGTVKSRVARARDHLIAQLRGAHSPDGPAGSQQNDR